MALTLNSSVSMIRHQVAVISVDIRGEWGAKDKDCRWESESWLIVAQLLYLLLTTEEIVA